MLLFFICLTTIEIKVVTSDLSLTVTDQSISVVVLLWGETGVARENTNNSNADTGDRTWAALLRDQNDNHRTSFMAKLFFVLVTFK